MTRAVDLINPLLKQTAMDKDGFVHYAYLPYSGITKRELFAAMAMQGLVTMFQTNMNCEDHIALLAVEHADALIEALNEPKEKP